MQKNIIQFNIHCIEDLVHELQLEPEILDGVLPDHNLLTVKFRSSGLYVEEFVRGLGVTPQTANRSAAVPRKYHSQYMKNDRIGRLFTKLLSSAEQKELQQHDIDHLNKSICEGITAEMKRYGKKKKRKKTSYKPYWNQCLSNLWKEMRRCYSVAQAELKGRPRRQLLLDRNPGCAVSEFQKSVRTFDTTLRRAKRAYNGEMIDSLDTLVNTQDPKCFRDEVNKLGTRKKNSITCEAIDEHGNISRDPGLVLRHWESEYRRLYSEAPEGEFDEEFYLEKLLELEELDPDENSDVMDLNREITMDEVKKAIYTGKKNKACGNDGIPYEALQEDWCVRLFHDLFTKCFTSGLLPSEWSNCLIVPISKGARSVNTKPLTFRGLALQSCIYKCYSYILNRRLDLFLESNNLISDVQNGFRRGRSCTDHVFALAETIRLNTGTPKQKVYACFFDMRRAFDEVDRNLLLLRLQSVGVKGNMYRAMCAIYRSPQCKVRLGDSGLHTSWIKSNYGTLQGDVVSPKNFSVQIDLLLRELNDSGYGLFYGPNAGERFSCLAFADDIVVVAPTQADLQKLINIVHSYCMRWRMTVNAGKTKTMVFRKNRQTKYEKISMHYGDILLEQVNQYKYLGVIFDETLKFDLANDDLASSGSRALDAIIAKSKFYNGIGYKSYTKLIDACVNSVTDYCSEVLGHETPKKILDVQLRAARFHLGVSKFTALCSLIGEIGWLPANYRRQLAVLRYYNRLMRMDISRIPRRVFESTLNRPGSWAWKTRDLLTSLGLDLYWSMGSAVPVELIQFYVRENMKSEWRQQVASKPKLRLYKEIKVSPVVSSYVAANIPKCHRSKVAQLMTGSLKLGVETGRYVNAMLDDRVCELCDSGEVEDEKHFLFHCQSLNLIRSRVLEQTDNLSIPGLLKRPFVFGRLVFELWRARQDLLAAVPMATAN